DPRAEVQPSEVIAGKRQQNARRNGECSAGGGHRTLKGGSVGEGIIGGAEAIQLDVCIRRASGPGDRQTVGAREDGWICGIRRGAGHDGKCGSGDRGAESGSVRSSRSANGERAGGKVVAGGAERGPI